MLSIVIPSRQPEYIQKTIDGLLDNAKGEVEVIVVFDGIWPEKLLRDDSRLVQIHHGVVDDNIGMRGSISAGMRVAKGDFVMKLDEHCMVGEGYDQILAENCQADSVVIPRRKRLEPGSWKLINDGRPDIDYMYVEYPYLKPLDKTQGLHGAEWRRPEREALAIDEVPTMQGSCWFMRKSYYDQLFPDGLDDENYGPFTQEAQEVSMKAWLSGGRVVVNKDTFYAHYHKGTKGKGYNFTTAQYKRHSEQNERGRLYCINHWLNTKDYKYDFNWFVTEKFPDMPGWSRDWRERVEKDRLHDYSTLNYAGDFWLEGLRDER